MARTASAPTMPQALPRRMARQPLTTNMIAPSTRVARPSGLAEWCELHEQIDRLAEPEREVVDLLFYQGLTQAEAAALLDVTVRTVQRRWHTALLQLHTTLHGKRPQA